jgi:hypothetical protein
MSKELVRLDDFMDWQGQARGVEIESHFSLPPYVPAEAINVDVSRIALLAKIGRVAGLSIGSYSEDSSVSYTATGINSDGSATAGAIKVAAASRSRSFLQKRANNARSFPRGEYALQLNLNHPDMDDKVLRSPKPWTNLLDKAIKDGLKDISKTQLTEPGRLRFAKFTAHNLIDLSCWTLGADLAHAPYIVPLFLGTRIIDEGLGVSSGLSNFLLKRRGRESQDYEKSFVLNYPIDRLLAVRALASTTKLVKTSSNK